MSNRRLTPQQVHEIRTRYAASNGPSIRQLAKEYGVSKSLIWRILHHEIYKEGVADD